MKISKNHFLHFTPITPKEGKRGKMDLCVFVSISNITSRYRHGREFAWKKNNLFNLFGIRDSKRLERTSIFHAIKFANERESRGSDSAVFSVHSMLRMCPELCCTSNSLRITRQHRVRWRFSWLSAPRPGRFHYRFRLRKPVSNELCSEHRELVLFGFVNFSSEWVRDRRFDFSELHQ